MQNQQAPAPLPVDHNTISYFMARLLRVDQFFRYGVQEITPDLFNKPGEEAFAIIWNSLCEYHDTDHRSPTLEGISTLAVGRASMRHGIIPEIIKLIGSVLDWCYEIPEQDLTDEISMGYLKAFLNDRKLGGELERAAETRRYGGAVDLPAIARRITDTSRAISSIGRSVSCEMIPEELNYDPDSMALVPCGVPFIDNLMGGGSGPTDVNIVLGPTGAGKTLLGVQICTARARLENYAEQTGGKTGMVVYFSYEAGIVELRARIVCCAAQIRASKMRTLTAYNDLTTTANMEDYERELFAGLPPEQSGYLMGERERLFAVRPWVNKYLKGIDFSRNLATAIGGYGGIGEVRQVLARMQDEQNMPISMVVLDWAGTAVENYIDHNRLPTDAKYSELSKYVGNVYGEVSTVFNCPVWVMHQLNGMAASAAPTRQPSHTDAEGCKAFAMRAYTAICLGTKDLTNSTLQLGATKTRSSQSQPFKWCRVNGEFSEIVPIGNELTYDNATRRVQRTADMNSVCNHVPRRTRSHSLAEEMADVNRM